MAKQFSLTEARRRFNLIREVLATLCARSPSSVRSQSLPHVSNTWRITVFNRLEEKDANGNFFIRELMDATTDDTNFVTYYYLNASQNNRVDKKLGYAMRVDDEWWLGSGIYLGPANTAVSEPVDTQTGEIVVSNQTK